MREDRNCGGFMWGGRGSIGSEGRSRATGIVRCIGQDLFVRGAGLCFKALNPGE